MMHKVAQIPGVQTKQVMLEVATLDALAMSEELLAPVPSDHQLTVIVMSVGDLMHDA